MVMVTMTMIAMKAWNAHVSFGVRFADFVVSMDNDDCGREWRENFYTSSASTPKSNMTEGIDSVMISAQEVSSPES
jgi:hypothetical protein